VSRACGFLFLSALIFFRWYLKIDSEACFRYDIGHAVEHTIKSTTFDHLTYGMSFADLGVFAPLPAGALASAWQAGLRENIQRAKRVTLPRHPLSQRVYLFFDGIEKSHPLAFASAADLCGLVQQIEQVLLCLKTK
jgi:hypothetical protein